MRAIEGKIVVLGAQDGFFWMMS
ncbi:hypothetical protein Bhyg_02808 [Pseudolycoriella hygida]|uniref:Uncharacterized protein n=1 Tax=Pseudolycoriella hygida TaxID=35572 RepID=A0A9Q0S8R3_9DIPT|nr:hypothetical protein Bhyg_02808 [Pseudolycoriella hygida]